MTVRRNWVALPGKGGKEKDTKSHQVRRLTLDETTIELLREHRVRYEDMMRELGTDSHLHALRHYSATALLTAGVDLRTVAGDSAMAVAGRRP